MKRAIIRTVAGAAILAGAFIVGRYTERQGHDASRAIYPESYRRLVHWQNAAQDIAGAVDSAGLAALVRERCILPPTTWSAADRDKLCLAQGVYQFQLAAEAAQ